MKNIGMFKKHKIYLLCILCLDIILGSSVSGKPVEPLSEWDGTKPYFEPHVDPGELLKAVQLSDVEEISEMAMNQWAMYLDLNLKESHKNLGLIWKAMYRHQDDTKPSLYGSGGNCALYTGYYLAMCAYRFSAQPSEDHWNQLAETLNGIYLLTHVSPVPGVLARAIVTEKEFNDHMDFRRPKYVYRHEGKLINPLHPERSVENVFYYTKTTRDQLTGILYGLSVAWVSLQSMLKPEFKSRRQWALNIMFNITHALYQRIDSQGFQLRDHLGKSGTMAKNVSGYLTLQLTALYRRVLRDILGDAENSVYHEKQTHMRRYYEVIADRYDRQFKRILFRRFFFDWIHPLSNIHQYYAWNLRFVRAYSIFILDNNESRRLKIFQKMKEFLWEGELPFTGSKIKIHENSFFTFLYFDIWIQVWNHRNEEYASLGWTENSVHNPYRSSKYISRAIRSLKSLMVRPLRSWPSPLEGRKFSRRTVLPVHLRAPAQHFVWQMPPWETGKKGHENGLLQATGIDYLLPFWLAENQFRNWEDFWKTKAE